MKILIFLIILFQFISTRPVDQPQNIKENIATNPTTSKPRLEDHCYFSQFRKTELETEQRPQKSEVSLDCSEKIFRLSDFFNTQLNQNTGETNAIALLLCRGAGECDLDFTNPEVFKKWKDVKICESHANELLLKWDDSISFRHNHIYREKHDGRMVEACSMPDNICPKHGSRPTSHLHSLTIQGSHAILKKLGFLVHPGIPICPTHEKEVMNLITPEEPANKRARFYKSSYAGLDDDTCASDPSITFPEFSSRNPAADALKPFLKYVKVDRVCFPWKEFDDLEEESKQKKVCAVKQMIDVIADIVAKGNPKELKKRVCSKYADKEEWSTGSSKSLDNVLKQVASQFFISEDRTTRLIVLGLVANSVTLSKIREYIPDLSGYLYTEARRFARRKRDSSPIAKASKERYNVHAVQKFITFITSPAVMIGLPYGVRKVKLSDGSKQVIPDSIRQQCSSEIYTMYDNYLTEIMTEEEKKGFVLGKSSIFEILKVCAATNRKATTCVDYYIANGMESFDGLHEIIDGWIEESLTADDILKYLKTELFESVQYLRTDFRLHIKKYSRIADHCGNFALSDPKDPKMSSSCSAGQLPHQHDLKCDRCERMNSVLNEIEKFSKNFLVDAEEIVAIDSPNPLEKDKLLLEKRKEDVERIKKYIFKIFEMKKHLLRSAYTSQERQNIINALGDNEALITLDFAQKYLPTWHRERQSDYFGKKGISYHVSHVTAKIGDKYAQHTFVHIYSQEVSQDSKLVVQTIHHMATELNNIGIKKISLRSDNAGAYHCASTIHSLHWLMEKTGVVIDTYTFSEAQNGKGASDRAASQVKYKAERYVAQHNSHNIITAENFFDAMKHEYFLNGFSFHLGTVSTPDGEAAKWPGISNLNHFKVEKDGIRGFRYGGIGEGLFVPKSSLHPSEGSYTFQEAGYVATGVSIEEERKAFIDGKETKFWYYPNCAKKNTCVAESDKTTPEVDDSVPNDAEIGNLFPCPEPGCSATFLKASNLEKHVLKDQHRVSPEKLTQRDYGLKLYSQALEKVESEHTSLFAKEALDQLQESKSQTSLSEGYGLPEKQVRKPFGKKVTKYLIDRFEEGLEKKAKPMDPITVVRRMETEKNSDGSKMFSIEELKDVRQIAGFFTRESGKRRNKSKSKRAAEVNAGEYEEYVHDEDEHDDSEWIQWLKDEAFLSLADEFFNATVFSDEPIFDYRKN